MSSSEHEESDHDSSSESVSSSGSSSSSSAAKASSSSSSSSSQSASSSSSSESDSQSSSSSASSVIQAPIPQVPDQDFVVAEVEELSSEDSWASTTSEDIKVYDPVRDGQYELEHARQTISARLRLRIGNRTRAEILSDAFRDPLEAQLEVIASSFTTAPPGSSSSSRQRGGRRRQRGRGRERLDQESDEEEEEEDLEEERPRSTSRRGRGGRSRGGGRGASRRRNTNNSRSRGFIVPAPWPREPAAAEGAATCVVCLVNGQTTVTIPCGHNVVCVSCSQRYKTMEETERICPVCRTDLQGFVRVTFS